MWALGTCRGDILRGVGVDEYGDETDADTVVVSGVLAAVQERASTVFDQASQTPRVVRTITGQFPNGTDLRVTDRFRDTTKGILYTVENVSDLSGPGYRSDILAELRRVT